MRMSFVLCWARAFGSCSIVADQLVCIMSEADASAAEKAVCLLSSLGKASTFVASGGSEVGAACEAAKETLLGRAREMIDSALGAAVLSSKSCDGTPIRTQFEASRQLPSGKRVQARGKQGRELLVSNQFIRYNDPVEGWQTCCLLSEPVPLSEGKAASAILAAARRTWRSLRSLGATHCVLEHYCWDRASITALEREVREWHLTQPVPISDDFEPGVLELMEFVAITPCALHDSQNAFRWGLLSQCQDRQLMRDVYISVEALRNSADLLHSRMNTWLVSVMDFHPARGEDWVGRQRAVWTALGVEADLAELLATELELCWEGDKLWVKEGAKVAIVANKNFH